MRVNALAVGEMARWSADNGALMVHFSTDYVFDGSSEDAIVKVIPLTQRLMVEAKQPGKSCCLMLEGPHCAFVHLGSIRMRDIIFCALCVV